MPVLRRSWALAAAALVATAQLALASFGVDELAVSSTPDMSGSAATFPVGTELVYVVYRYSGAQGEKIQINVEMSNLPELYQSPARTYRGDGSDSVPIRGADIYRSLAARMDENLAAIGDILLLIENQTLVHDYFLQIRASANATTSVAEVVAGFKDSLSAGLLSDAEKVRRLMADIGALADEALELPQSDLEGKRALAAEIRSLAQAASASAQNISSHAASVTKMPLPATASAVDGFTVQVWKDGGLHRDTAFGIAGSGSQAAGSVVDTGTATAVSEGAPAATATSRRQATDALPSQADSAAPAVATGVSASANRQATVLAGNAMRTAPAGQANASPTAPSERWLAGTATLLAPTGAPTGAADSLGQVGPWPTAGPAGMSSSEAGVAPTGAPLGTAVGSATEGSGTSAPRPGRTPNAAVLAAGAVALVVAAFWLRQRL